MPLNYPTHLFGIDVDFCKRSKAFQDARSPKRIRPKRTIVAPDCTASG